MTTATITQGNLVYFPGVAQTVTAPRRQRPAFRWPWWWPTVLRARLIRCENNFDVLMGVLSRYEGCPA